VVTIKIVTDVTFSVNYANGTCVVNTVIKQNRRSVVVTHIYWSIVGVNVVAGYVLTWHDVVLVSISQPL